MLLGLVGVLVIVVGAAVVASVRHRGSSARPAEQTFTVQRRPFVSTISAAGTVVPGRSVEVVAPFDGVVKIVGFDYGRQVTAGQVLVAMDLFELQLRARDARSSYLKASEAAADVANWQVGPDVARARRAVTTAAAAVKKSERTMSETKGLLDRGLVARSEYEGATEQHEADLLSLTAAQEDLAVTLKKGLGPSRETADIDLQNARAKLNDLNAQLGGATVRAPATGIIVRSPAAKSDAGNDVLHAGGHLNRGQLIGEIATIDSLALAVKLDEADANRVREGQAVSITGPGFAGMTLAGHVATVAGEASQAEGGAGGPSFAATIGLDGLSSDQARAVRIGMSANATITIYETASAIVIPPQAVIGEGGAATVNVRDPRTGHSRSTPIVVGMVSPNGVEVRSGLGPGDLVTWTAPTSSVSGGQPAS